MEPSLKTRDLAELCGSHVKTVEKAARAGEIPGAFKSPGGHWRFNVEQVLPWLTKRQTAPAYEVVIEMMYDLSRAELRRAAYEALLISDGPDHIDGDVSDATVVVNRQQNGTFKIFESGR